MEFWFSLLLAYGLVVIGSLNGATGLAIFDGRLGKDIPHSLTKTVHQVEKHYDLASRQWVGSGVFTPYLDKIETCTCEKLALAAMLNSYADIFSNMLKESKEIEGLLKDMQANVTHLQETKYSKEQRVLTQLQEIKHKNVKDHKIQLGAMKDFLSVYEKAFRLGQRQ